MPRKTKQQIQYEEQIKQLAIEEYNNQLITELSSISDYISQFSSSSGISDVKLSDLHNWLRNPQKNLEKLILLSRYYYNKEGIITDIYDMFKTLPILTYSCGWQNMQMKKFATYKKRADEFLKNIQPKQLARDTIFTAIQDGTCVWYNVNNKYILFLEYNQYKIDTLINGKWRVDYDLSTFDLIKNIEQLKLSIESAPTEVTLEKYNLYKKDKSKRYVPLDINKTQVIKLRGDRNTPRGVPYAIGAMPSIIHRDLLESTEKAIANRVNNQIIVQTVGSTGGKENPKPPSPESIKRFHESLKKIVQNTANNNNYDSSGAAPLTVPEWVKISELEIKMNVFPKEVYERIDRSVYQKLGFSPSINMGGMDGQSYGGGSINVEKIFSIVFYLIEQIENGLTDYLNQIVTTVNFNPNIRFSRMTLVDKDTQVQQNKDLYTLGRGSLKTWVESVGHDFDHWLEQVKYENEVLKLDDILKVHPTSYTDSGDNSGGRPSDNKPVDDNDSNNIPSPSD